MPDGIPTPTGPADANAILTLANLVTFARLCAVPLAVWLVLRGRLQAACLLFLAAGLSDALDGWLARRRGSTRLGALLDPLADKALLVSMFITLAAIDRLPDFVAIIVVFRDLLIIGGVLLLALLHVPVQIRPIAVSRLNTVLQIALVGAVLFLSGFALSAPLLVRALVWSVVASTVISGAVYVWKVAATR